MDFGSSAFPHGKVTLFYLSVHTLMDSGRSLLGATVNSMALTTQVKVSSVVSISSEHLPEDMSQNINLWRNFRVISQSSCGVPPSLSAAREVSNAPILHQRPLSVFYPSISLCAKWRRSVLLSCICFAKLLCLFWVLCISIWILESTCRFLSTRRIIGILIKVVLNWHIDQLEECRHSNNAQAQTL